VTQNETKIVVAGITSRAINYIDGFMKKLKEAGFPTEKMLPMIGMPIATALSDAEGNPIEQTGPRLVLGALEKSQLTDEKILKTEPFDIAIRIPEISEFAGSYYFDIDGRRFVNIFKDGATRPRP
jgi:hypothetical protein